MHVYRSMIIPAPLDAAWSAVRNFDAVSDWNPGVTAAKMESGSPTATGHVRHLDIAEDSVFRETLLAHSDREHFYTYDIIESPLPVEHYVSTHRFLPITHSNETLSIWEGWFDCAPGDQDEMAKIVGDDIYIGGMAGLVGFLTST